MAMSSYDVVRRAVEFEKPERLPLRFGGPDLDYLFGALVLVVHCRHQSPQQMRFLCLRLQTSCLIRDFLNITGPVLK